MLKIICALVLFTSPLLAAEAPQYNPVTIDEQDFHQIEAWANEQPTKFGAPLLRWLYAIRQRADAKVQQQPKADVPPDYDPS